MDSEEQADDLEAAREDANWFSEQASKNLRALALAGIGVTWVLTGQKVEGFRDHGLWGALFLFLAVMAADFFHYAQTASRLGADIKAREVALPAKPPEWIARPGRLWYVAKMTLLGVAYLWLMVAFSQRVFGVQLW